MIISGSSRGAVGGPAGMTWGLSARTESDLRERSPTAVGIDERLEINSSSSMKSSRFELFLAALSLVSKTAARGRSSWDDSIDLLRDLAGLAILFRFYLVMIYSLKAMACESFSSNEEEEERKKILRKNQKMASWVRKSGNFPLSLGERRKDFLVFQA
jgi:hypothetical protein